MNQNRKKILDYMLNGNYNCDFIFIQFLYLNQKCRMLKIGNSMLMKKNNLNNRNKNRNKNRMLNHQKHKFQMNVLKKLI